MNENDSKKVVSASASPASMEKPQISAHLVSGPCPTLLKPLQHIWTQNLDTKFATHSSVVLSYLQPVFCLIHALPLGFHSNHIHI